MTIEKSLSAKTPVCCRSLIPTACIRSTLSPRTNKGTLPGTRSRLADQLYTTTNPPRNVQSFEASRARALFYACPSPVGLLRVSACLFHLCLRRGNGRAVECLISGASSGSLGQGRSIYIYIYAYVAASSLVCFPD